MKVKFEGGPLDGMEGELADGKVDIPSQTDVPFDIDQYLISDLPAAPDERRPRYRAAYIVFREVW